jgi:uncharacterized protein YqgC (DUF456 family)
MHFIQAGWLGQNDGWLVTSIRRCYHSGMSAFLIAMLVLVSVLGIILAALQLPGTWLILGTAVLYDWHYDWQRLGWKWLVLLAGVAALAELLEMLASLAMARRAGASRRAAVGALIGGFAGMILLSVPVPVIGTIIGGLIGCFVGALLGEISLHDNLHTGARVGVFATIGRVMGMMAKTAAAMVIGGAVISLAVWQ